MIATPDNVRVIAAALDHPESVYVTPDGTVYAGGEAGQVYRLDADGATTVGCTGGNLLGIVLDAEDCAYVADYRHRAVFRVDGSGVERYSTGTADRPLAFPNQPLFASDGALFITDSGDYWDRKGTGCLFRVDPSGRTDLYHSGPFRFANGCALHPSDGWLYVAETPASRIVRVPADRSQGPIEIAWQLPEGWLPDGICFTDDGRLIVACYRPDQIAMCHPGGGVSILLRDPSAELLIAPTNVFLYGGDLYVANLGGYHLTVIATDLRPGPVYRPLLR